MRTSTLNALSQMSVPTAKQTKVNDALESLKKAGLTSTRFHQKGPIARSSAKPDTDIIMQVSSSPNTEKTKKPKMNGLVLCFACICS